MPRPSPEISYSSVTTGSWAEGGTTSWSSAPFISKFREHNSRDTPNFAMLKRLKLLPQNGYQMHSYHITTGTWSATQHHWYDGRPLVWSQNSVWASAGTLPLSLQPVNLVTEAKNKAFLKYSKKASAVQVNVAEFFGERRQTANLIAHTAQRVAKAALALKRADFKAFTQALDLAEPVARRAKSSWHRVQRTTPSERLANHWLEYKYGWRPLLSDVHDAAEMLAKRVVDPQKNFGSIRASATVVQPVSILSPRSGESHVCYDTFSSHFVHVKAYAEYVLENEARSVLAQTGITNPLLLAWELLPYSFVIDWFVPVGTYLESLTAFDGFTLSRTYTSIRENSGSSIQVSYYQKPGPPSNWDSVVGGSAEASEFRYTLQPGANLGYEPTLKSPIGGNPLDRGVTALALLTQLFSRNPRV